MSAAAPPRHTLPRAPPHPHRPVAPRLGGVQSVDVIHAAAVLTVALLVIRGLQAIAEHYFPESEAVAAARFIHGGP